MAAGDHRLGFYPQEEEVEIDRLPVEGEIPRWLSGTLVRNGPATWQAGGQELRHWFDGLAMLHKFDFRDGEVAYANRFLRSPQYRHVQERGKLGYSEFATDPCRRIFKRLVTRFAPPAFGHNASVSVHQLFDRFVAMTETPLPVEFDPDTLDTVGVVGFEDGVAATTSSPHPHTETRSGDYLNTITHFSRRCSYKVFRVPKAAVEAGEGLRREVLAELPVKEPAYMHSFGQTENHVVLAEYPLVVNPLKVLLKDRPFAENLEWRPHRPTRFLVIEKTTGETVAIRNAEPFFCFHHVNAFEREGEVLVDLLAYPDASIIDRLYLEVLRDPEANIPASSVAELRRYRIRLSDYGSSPRADGPLLDYEVLSEARLELPRIDERRTGREYDRVYGVGASHEGQSGWVDQLVRVEVRERDYLTWRREGCYPGEPVFVARPGADTEDGGLILSVVLDAAEGGSFLLALDARSFEEVATARVPHRVPFDFHGRYFARAGETRPVRRPTGF